jgi:hypothetical protein
VVFAGAIDGFAVSACHLAADHGHGAPNLQDGAVDADFGACCCQVRVRGGLYCEGGRLGKSERGGFGLEGNE